MITKKKCYCPSCKSLLNLQPGFSPKNEKHICSECGRTVNVVTGEFPQDEESEELYFGDFSVKEGKYGNIDDETDNEKTAPLPELPPEVGSGPPQYYEYDEEGEPFPPPYDEGEYPPPPPPPPQQQEAQPQPQQAAPEEEEDSLHGLMAGIQKWKSNNVKPLMIAKLGLIGIACIVAIALFLANLVPMGYDSDQLQGLDRRSVAEMLERQGFKRVKTKALDDLGLDQIKEENIVRSIDVGDVSEFKSTKHFLKWKKIVIYYSSIQKKSLPISSKDIDDMNYHDLEAIFENAGFVNVKTEPVEDLKLGLLNSEDEVKEVFVNNKNKFSANDKYRPDTEIIITYHAFKSKD